MLPSRKPKPTEQSKTKGGAKRNVPARKEHFAAQPSTQHEKGLQQKDALGQQDHDHRPDTQKRQDDAETWNAIFRCLEFYQKSVLSEVGALIAQPVLYTYGDRHIQEVVIKNGLDAAFKRMRSRLEFINNQKGRAATLTLASVRNLVEAQNKFIKNELVTKLGVVEQTRLEAFLAVDRSTRRRAIVCHKAVLDEVTGCRGKSTTATAVGKGGTEQQKKEGEVLRARGVKPKAQPGVAASEKLAIPSGENPKPTDFSDFPEPDWQAEAAERTKLAEQERVEHAAAKNIGLAPKRTRRSSRGGGDEPAPPLVSDSDASIGGSRFIAVDPDRGDSRKGKKKVKFEPETGGVGKAHGVAGAPINAGAPAGHGEAPAKGGGFDPEAGDTGDEGGNGNGGTGGRGGKGAGKMDRSSIEKWVMDVVHFRLSPRPEHMKKFFRGWIESSTLSNLLRKSRGSVRQAVILCADMMDPPILIPKAHRELDRETAQLEQENEDLVAQVDDLLAGDGCKDISNLRALLEKAKGKPGLLVTRQKLKKAIHDLDSARAAEGKKDKKGQGGKDGDVKSDTDTDTDSDSDDEDSGPVGPLAKEAKELIAKGCKDQKRLEALLDRMRGKIGLGGTRKMLKKFVHQLAKTKVRQQQQAARPRPSPGQARQSLGCPRNQAARLTTKRLRKIESKTRAKIVVSTPWASTAAAASTAVEKREITVTGPVSSVKEAVRQVLQILDSKMVTVGDLDGDRPATTPYPALGGFASGRKDTSSNKAPQHPLKTKISPTGRVARSTVEGGGGGGGGEGGGVKWKPALDATARRGLVEPLRGAKKPAPAPTFRVPTLVQPPFTLFQHPPDRNVDAASGAPAGVAGTPRGSALQAACESTRYRPCDPPAPPAASAGASAAVGGAPGASFAREDAVDDAYTAAAAGTGNVPGMHSSRAGGLARHDRIDDARAADAAFAALAAAVARTGAAVPCSAAATRREAATAPSVDTSKVGSDAAKKQGKEGRVVGYARGDAPGEAEAGEEGDPHLEQVLRGMGRLALVPLFLEQEIDLKTVLLMSDDDFEKMGVAKGPQLKLKHACKKKLVELGLHSEEEEGATSTATATATGKGNIKKLNTGGGDASGANSPARCCICWENEVEITFVPCGHQSTCRPCGKMCEGKPCPLCCAKVEQAVRFFS